MIKPDVGLHAIIFWHLLLLECLGFLLYIAEINLLSYSSWKYEKKNFDSCVVWSKKVQLFF